MLWNKFTFPFSVSQSYDNKTKTHICMSGMFSRHLTQTQMVPRFVFEHPRDNNINIIID